MKKPTRGQWAALGLFMALIVAADQITKALTRAHIPYGGEVRFIPGVVRLTWTENTGAAFSMFSGTAPCSFPASGRRRTPPFRRAPAGTMS